MDYECPACKRDDLTPGLRLLFSNCGHQICEDCLKELFKNNTKINCPLCRKTLKRADFSVKLLEEREFEREFEIRRDVMSVFNSSLEDFESVRDYNDYLEEVEDLIEALLNQDAEAMTRLKQRRLANQSQIQANSERQDEAMKNLRYQAIISDSLYNESLKEEAATLIAQMEVEEEAYISKEMPECLNIDPSYSVESLEANFRTLFLTASGWDTDAEHRSAFEELSDGILAVII